MPPERKKRYLSLADIHKQQAEEAGLPTLTNEADEYQVFLEEIRARWDEPALKELRMFLKNYQQLRRDFNKDMIWALGIQGACVVEAWLIMDVLAFHHPIRVLGVVPGFLFFINAAVHMAAHGYGRGRKMIEEGNALVRELESLGFSVPRVHDQNDVEKILNRLGRVVKEYEAAELESMNHFLTTAELYIGDDGELVSPEETSRSLSNQ